MIAFCQQKYYGFVIKTNKYASDFVRDIVAYTIGVHDGFPPGTDYQNLFENELGEKEQEENSELVLWIPNEDGCAMCTMWNPDNGYKDIIILIKEIPSKSKIKAWKERAKKFPQISKMQDIQITGFDFVEFDLNWKLLKI
jgi:hypothetical protein